MQAPTVVVGFDESASARAALIWATDWARRTDARLRAVHVLDPEVDLGSAWYPGSVGWIALPTGLESQTDQRTRIGELFDNLAGDHQSHELEYAEGPVGPALVDAARGAALLVVGTRRLRGLHRAVEGSVSHYCLSHATCPVLAVPALPLDPGQRSPEVMGVSDNAQKTSI